MRNINHMAGIGAGTNRRLGFTLMEALIAAVILAVAVAGIVAPMSAAYQQTRSVKHTSIAISMAQQLLDEIVSRPFADPTDANTNLGPEAGEAGRASFDNIDDYHGYQDSTDNTASNSMKTLSGETVAWNSSDIYQRQVSVEYRATPAGPAVGSGDFMVVSVKVTMPHGHHISAMRLVAKYPRGT